MKQIGNGRMKSWMKEQKTRPKNEIKADETQDGSIVRSLSITDACNGHRIGESHTDRESQTSNSYL